MQSAEKLKRNLEGDFKNKERAYDSKDFIILALSKASSALNSNTKVICRIHGKEYLNLDSTKFKVHCTKCIDLGDKNKNLQILEVDEDSNDSTEETDCKYHPDINGNFYCDDCREFLCKQCFANEHRKHNSSTPLDIASGFKTQLKNVLENITTNRPKIEESLKEISEIDKKIKEVRDLSLNRVKEMTTRIQGISKAKLEKSYTSLTIVFEGVDQEIENIFKRLESIGKKVIKLSSELKEVSTSLTKMGKADSYEICNFKKSKHSIITEAKKLIEESNNLFNFKLPKTMQNAQTKISHFTLSYQKLFKELEVYQSSVLTSIDTGISSSSLRLRRFNGFSKKGLSYYKTSSLVVKPKENICLVGAGMCGLYLKDESEEEKIMISNDFPFRLTISEIKEEEKKLERLSQEKHYFRVIKNNFDPTFVLYFTKALYLKQDRKYLITIENLHREAFLEIWCGEVPSIFLPKLVQNVTCNSSGAEFEFSVAAGYESDFDEFHHGIISDLIYSNIE